MRVRLVEITRCRKGACRTSALAIIKRGTSRAFAGRLFSPHRLEYRRIEPDLFKIIVEYIADHHGNKATRGDVAIGAQVQG